MCDRVSIPVQKTKGSDTDLDLKLGLGDLMWRTLTLLLVMGASTGSGLAANLVGTIQFGPATNYAGGSYSYSVAGIVVADVNRDGKPDILVARHYGLEVLFGEGGNFFSSPVDITLHSDWLAIAMGDFNNDGNLDFIAADQNSNTSIFLGDGLGNFLLFTNYTTFGSYQNTIVVGDFNGDGKDDLALVNNLDPFFSIKVAIGRGDGSFSAPSYYVLAGQPHDLCIGDLNGDGKPDLVVCLDSSGYTFCVLMNNGNGTFGAPQYYGNVKSWSLALGDFNGDGRLDVVAKNYNTNSLMVFLNNGVGVFSSTNSIPVGLNLAGIATADFNGDGKLDILLRDDVTAKFLSGNGDGSFVIGPNFSVPSGGTTHTVAGGDFNGDGLPDLIIGGSGSAVTIMLNQTPPLLQITPMAGYNQISWPAVFGAFALESTTNLPPSGNWQSFPYPPVVFGNQKGVTDWSTEKQKYYRLKKP